MMGVLKNKGLTQETHDECQNLLMQLTPNSKTRVRLEQWLEKHITIHLMTSDFPLLTSSDIIESLFGKFKYFLERSSNKDINRSILLIPGMYGSLSEVEMAQTRGSVGYKDLQVWAEKNSNSKEIKNKFSKENCPIKMGDIKMT
jgi:hypothetical protein